MANDLLTGKMVQEMQQRWIEQYAELKQKTVAQVNAELESEYHKTINQLQSKHNYDNA